MGAFKSAVITTKGQALLAKAILNTADLEFTKIAISETQLTGDIASKTGIGTIKQTVKVASVQRANNNSVKVSASITNEELTSGYYIRNIGLYAKDPDEGEILYSISVADESNATADWMPPFNSIGISSLMIDLITVVSNTDNVVVEVDPTALATVAQLTTLHEQVLDELITVKEAQGTSVVLTDSASEPFVGIKIFGKSTQAGDPTPNDPQEIISVGDRGNVTVSVYGLNLCENTWENGTINSDTGVNSAVAGEIRSIDFIPVVANQNIYTKRSLYTGAMKLRFYDANKSYVGMGNADTINLISGNTVNNPMGVNVKECVFQIKDPRIKYMRICDTSNSLDTLYVVSLCKISTNEYKKKQAITLSTPNGLRGVKTIAHSLVTYTDADGTMWLGDEIDLDKGVYVKRLGTTVIDNTVSIATGALGDGWYRHMVSNSHEFSKNSAVPKISNRYPYVANYSEKSNHFYIDTAIWVFNQLTHDEFIADLADNPITIVGGLETYEEIPLTKDELSAYRALCSNNPVTHIVNDVDAYMGIEYYNKTSENILKPVMSRLNSMEKQVSDLETFTGYDEDDIYGIEVDFSSKTITRLAGAENLKEGADFDKLDPWGGRKRCIVDDNGDVLAYYGEYGYTETGALVEEISIDSGTWMGDIVYPIGTHVQVMVEQPIFYIKAVPVKAKNATSGKGKQYVKARFYISPTPKSGFSIPRAFYNDNGVPQDKIYLSAYEGSVYDASAEAWLLNDEQVVDFDTDKLCSMAGAKPASGVEQALVRSNARKLCNNRGRGWQLHNIFAMAVTEWLFMVEYASLDPQRKVGQGVCNLTDDYMSNLAVATGGTYILGNGSGIQKGGTDGKCSVTYRGEENLWGNICTWLDCINVYGFGVNEVWVTKIGTAPVDGTSSGYDCLGAWLSHSDGYISSFGIDPQYPELLIPAEASGSDTFADYILQDWECMNYVNASFGGTWGSGSQCGFYWDAYMTVGDRNQYHGARLLYVPQTNASW